MDSADFPVQLQTTQTILLLTLMQIKVKPWQSPADPNTSSSRDSATVSYCMLATALDAHDSCVDGFYYAYRPAICLKVLGKNT